MSLETVSTKRNRVYERAFDHDECRALRAEDPKRWTWKALAEHYDVSIRAIERVLKPHVAERMNAYSLQWTRENKREPCKGGCGALVWMHMKERSGYCPACAGLLRSKTVRPTELLCTRCDDWKPDEAFPANRNTKGRRGRHVTCRVCQTIVRREHRQRNRQAENDRDRAYKRQVREETKKVGKFIVFTPNGDGFKEVARVEAASAIGAIEKAAEGAGEYVAVSETRFRVMKVEPVQKFAVVPQEPGIPEP
jgi:hypothetical protein